MAGWISIGFGGDVGTDFRAGWLIRHPLGRNLGGHFRDLRKCSPEV